MHKTDVAILVGGFAGSLAAAMLGRAGIDCTLVDPNEIYPDDFRCEKLDGPQTEILRKTGLAAPVLKASTFDGACWMARFGRVIEKRPGDQQGFHYSTLVNTIRGEIPSRVPLLRTKAQAITAGSERQTVTLASGENLDARLVVLANGLSVSVRDSLGLNREIVSRCHSIAIGFTIKPREQRQFAFPALTYYAERPSDKTALVTFFPIGDAMRANRFVYREFDDPWLRSMRSEPQATLFALMPKLRPILGDFLVEGRVEIRPIDLYVTQGHRQAGVVLVGDAYATSCPAAGTGARKVLNDVERLCNHHIPQWLDSPGMGEAKIAAFYDDPIKRACDDFATEKAFSLKEFSIDTNAAATAHRWFKFGVQATRGIARALLDGTAPRDASVQAIKPAATAKPLQEATSTGR
jgi:2-polyprenyl-6-methoxyphenol hydroxylase-like FAD-dependent oxidoreductase